MEEIDAKGHALNPLSQLLSPHHFAVRIGRLFSLALLCFGVSGCVGANGDLGVGKTQTTSNMQTAAIPGASAGGLRVVKELPPPPPGEDGASQQIAKNDVLQVDVFQVDELDRVVQVDSLGYIALPLIGQIEAAGNSVSELAKKIEAKYGQKYLQSPEVSVFVKESIGQRVVVNGEVAKTGIYPVTAESSLLAVVTQAGGLTQIADQSKVYVYRKYGEQKLVANYHVGSIRSGKRPDPLIYGGDVIVVFASATRVAMRNLLDVARVASATMVFVP